MSEIQILTFKELLAQPEPPWLIEEVIRADQVAVVYGPPNGGKTFLVLDWGMHIAAGVAWLGHPVSQGPVVYMAGEGAFSLQKRAGAWANYHHREDVPMFFQTRPIDMRSEDVLEELRAALDGYQDLGTAEEQLNPVLVIVDTLSQFFGGGDENGSDMAQFVQACRSLSQSHQTAVLIVHHTNATGLRERGNTALRGNTDVMFEVKAIEEANKLVGVSLQNDKHRDDPKSAPMSLRLSAANESLVISGLKSGGPGETVVSLSEEKQRELLRCALSVEDSESERVSLVDWMKTAPYKTRTFYRHLRNLKKLKLVKEAGKGQYKFTDLGRATAYSVLPDTPFDTQKPQLVTVSHT